MLFVPSFPVIITEIHTDEVSSDLSAAAAVQNGQGLFFAFYIARHSKILPSQTPIRQVLFFESNIHGIPFLPRIVYLQQPIS
jgi:hypothetical protein